MPQTMTMRTTTPDTAAPQTQARLREIQQQIADVCQPHYHEFHRVTTERGFTKITIPKTTGRR